MYIRKKQPLKITWQAIIRQVVSAPFGKEFQIKKSIVMHPVLIGFRKSYGLPKGEIANWRLGLATGACIHVREYQNYFLVHMDEVDPGISLLDHLRKDAPVVYLAGCGAMASIAGYLLKGSGKALEWGVGGSLFGIITL